MKRIALVFILFFSICILTSAKGITPILRVVEDSIVKMGQIDENTGLFWAKFINMQDNSEAAGIYIFNKSRKYKFIALYLNFETDKETFVLYRKNHNKMIGPIGSGVVKDNFVSWIYDMDIRPSPTEIVFRHYKNFDPDNKQGNLIMEYKVYLVELAKEMRDR